MIVISVVSQKGGSGKTTLAIHLAAAASAAGYVACLIDTDPQATAAAWSDWRKGQLHRHFGLAARPGLSEAIAGALPWTSAIHREVLPRLDFLATGGLPASRAELLMQSRLRLLLFAASQEYELVLLDTPPVLALADALVLGSHADAVYLAVRAGVSGEAEVVESIRRLNQAGAPLQGLLFNDLPLALSAYGYRYGYDGLARLAER